MRRQSGFSGLFTASRTGTNAEPAGAGGGEGEGGEGEGEEGGVEKLIRS